MCGIFGWNLKEGTLSNAKRKILYDLLAAQNDTRGGHSWGVCTVDRATKTPALEHGLGALFDARFEKALPWKSDVMFAHTRFATHGDKTVSNAHPFHVGKIIGAHNGVLSNHGWLNEEYGRDFKVDSQHIFAHIDEGEDLKDLEGYGAIEYISEADPAVVFLGTFNHYLSVWRLKPDEKTETSDGIIWTSDVIHARFALKMLRTYHESMIVKDEYLYEISDAQIFETDTRMKVRRAAQKWNWRDGETGKFRSHSQSGKGSNNVVYPYGYSGGQYHSILCSATRCTNKRLENSTLCQECSDKTVPPNVTVVRGLLPASSTEPATPDTSGDSRISSEDWKAFTESYCQNCYDRNEDCRCGRKKKDSTAEMVVDCPLCGGEGFTEDAVQSDFVRCKRCRGQGSIIVEVEADSSFDVIDGHNDRLMR